MYEGDTGPDVRELNANLVALGYATSSELDPDSDYFNYETAYALERLQYKLGEEQTGSLTEGQAVFLLGQIRISTVSATLGSNAAPGSPIMQATSTSREVVVELDAAEQTEVAIGDQVQISLPDGQATPGVVSSTGTVASSSGSSASGGDVAAVHHAQASEGRRHARSSAGHGADHDRRGQARADRADRRAAGPIGKRLRGRDRRTRNVFTSWRRSGSARSTTATGPCRSPEMLQAGERIVVPNV